LPGKRRPWA